MSTLQVDSVVKSYGDKRILTDIFLSCKKGEILGLFGRNGCGKSTLLKIIFGVLESYSRFVSVNGKRISSLREGYKHIKYLPQDGFLPDYTKIKTIIRLYCNADNAKSIASHPLINTLLNKRSRELSGGERRFFEVLLMVYSNADFVLIDEPFNGISPLYVDEIKALIREQSALKGFVITDHSYGNIFDLATRKILMTNGTLKDISTKEDLKYWGYTRTV